jgi:hypothetical protein
MLLDQITTAGIVGCGGAGFPTAVKYNTNVKKLFRVVRISWQASSGVVSSCLFFNSFCASIIESPLAKKPQQMKSLLF